MRKETLLKSLVLGGWTILFLAACSGGGDENAVLEASGFIESTSVDIVAESSGRVAEVLAEESDPVAAGDPLIVLDDTLLQSDLAQAAAALASAQANLDQVLNGATDEEIAAAEADLGRAQAELTGAEEAYAQAQAVVANPQDIDIQLTDANTQVGLAEQAVHLAEAQLDEQRIRLNWLREDAEEPEDSTAVEFQEYATQIAEANLRAAQAQLEGARQTASLLQEQQQRPLMLIAQAHQAGAGVALAQAQVDAAQATVDLLHNGATEEEIAMAQAQVDMAEAQVALVEAQIAHLTLTAPLDGVVTTRSIHRGETAQQGIPLMTIADLSTLKLVVYIPETQIGHVRVGQQVDIAVDSYPGRMFEGEVINIARQAEFTPRNVQTEEERVNLVFAVEIRIPNPDGELTPGMPADATIHTE
jgi:HlyD family secretion protein